MDFPGKNAMVAGRPHRLTARTAPFHGVNRGSIPRGVTTRSFIESPRRFFHTVRMLTNGQYLLNVADAGLNLSMGNTQDYKEILVMVLLDIEEVLDRGRHLTFDSPETVDTISAKLDQVRARIQDLLAGIGKERATQILEYHGEYLKRQFVPV